MFFLILASLLFIDHFHPGFTVIPVNPQLHRRHSVKTRSGSTTLGQIALTGKYYRHPDSALISYPVVVEEPLGSINKPLNIAIVGAGAAGITALYELSNLADSAKNIRVTLYETDLDNFVHNFEHPSSADTPITPDKSDPSSSTHEPVPTALKTHGLKAGRISAAVSFTPGGEDHAVYEIGAMRFPEISGLLWHYARTLYGEDHEVDLFPNPGAVPTELVHGDRVERFGKGEWLNQESPAKHVVSLIQRTLFGQSEGDNISRFRIGGEDPAKISAKLKSPDTTQDQLEVISEQWKVFADLYDRVTLESAIRKCIESEVDQLPEVEGLPGKKDKINYYVELFGTVGFGTGGFRPFYNISFVEMTRLLLWDYTNEYLLPVTANVDFVRDLYMAALQKNPNVVVKLAKVASVAHIDQNPNGPAMVVYYYLDKNDGNESSKPQMDVYDFVILATTPIQTNSMISRIGFKNVARAADLGDYKRPLKSEDYQGEVRPALVLSEDSEAANSRLSSALNRVHMVTSSKIFATIKKQDFDKYAPEFADQGKIKAVVSNCGLGSCYAVPSNILDETTDDNYKDYYSFLISYTWEDDSKRLQHHFRKHPMNADDTDDMMNDIINHTVRHVTDPIDRQIKSWWFGEVLSKSNLEGPLSYDWTTYHSSGGFKLDQTGDHYNSHLLFRYHTHALNPKLKNKFFLANDSYSHSGGWIEGALISAVNAVCGLIVAANDGDINALSPQARVVLSSFENVAE